MVVNPVKCGWFYYLQAAEYLITSTEIAVVNIRLTASTKQDSLGGLREITKIQRHKDKPWGYRHSTKEKQEMSHFNTNRNWQRH